VRRLRERIQYLKIKRKSYRLLKDFARILSGKPNNVELKKEKDRDEKRFRIFADFIKISDNISFISSLKMFWASRSPRFFNFFNNRRRYLRKRRVLALLLII
jgi:DNA-binding SARP family transcriptional activator